MLLFDPKDWTIKGRWDGFEQHEQALCIRSMRLSGHHFLALATSNNQVQTSAVPVCRHELPSIILHRARRYRVTDGCLFLA